MALLHTFFYLARSCRRMSVGCRKCIPDNEDVIKDTYSTIVRHGGAGRLQARLEGIEATGKILPGVTLFCSRCNNVSVISYVSYRVMLASAKGEHSHYSVCSDDGDDTMCRAEYYSFLCDKYDMLVNAPCQAEEIPDVDDESVHSPFFVTKLSP